MPYLGFVNYRVAFNYPAG